LDATTDEGHRSNFCGINEMDEETKVELVKDGMNTCSGNRLDCLCHEL
jgi:hypothetical protein